MKDSVPTKPEQSTPIALPVGQRETVPPLDELRGQYRLRYARSAEDLRACFKLRFEVFNMELGEGLAESVESGLDRDRFDKVCDHLIVHKEDTGEVIGTYRMQTYEAAMAGHGFYSAGEYDLAGIDEQALRSSIELGRAAIHVDHRDRSVLILLWRGLMAYLRWNGARYFFGCSSLTSQDPQEGLDCYDYLNRKGYAHSEFLAQPLPDYRCSVENRQPFEGDFPVPKLFGFYLRFAAKVVSPPALDRTFGTIDFLTWTDTHSMAGKLAQTFSRDLPSRE